MKIAYSHIINHIHSKPSIEEISKKLFQLGHENEIFEGIFDIDITPNRGDCLSLEGILRDLSVFYEVNYPKIEYSQEFKELKLKFFNEAPKICKNISFLKIDIHNEIEPYKDELANYFDDLKLNKNNFFTDLSNYISYETGQPLHCYDFKKIADNEIYFKEIDFSEEFNTLLGKNILLTGKNAVFTSNKQIINLAGVVGGESTACSNDTRSVLVECAYFRPDSIIGKSIKYDLKSEASFKFERGVDINSHQRVLRRFLTLVNNHVKIKNVELYNNNCHVSNNDINFDIQKLNKIIGAELDEKTTTTYLERLGFIFLKDNVLRIPSFRSDISSLNDIAEEVARCIGYDNIKAKKININNKEKHTNLPIEHKIKDYLISKGFYEIVSFPFTQNKKSDSILIDNPLDKNKKYLRYDLKESLVEALLYNERRQKDSIKLFEISNIYNNQNNFLSNVKIGIIATGRLGRDYVNFSKKIDKSYLKDLFHELDNQKEIKIEIISRDDLKSKIKDDIYYFETELSDLISIFNKYEPVIKKSNQFIRYQKVSEQPYSYRDLSFSIANPKDFLHLDKMINDYRSNILKEKFIFDYYKNNETKALKVGYRFIFQSQDVTIKEKEVDKDLNDIIGFTKMIESVEIPGLTE